MVSDADRRAQLILVGSVSLALIIIGLTVVLNTVLFTSTVTTDVTVDASDDALRFDQTAREGVRSMVLRLNHGEKNVSRAQLRDSVGRNISNYTRLLRESYTVSRPVFVNVSLDGLTYGQRIVQAEDGAFESPEYDGSEAYDWDVIRASDETDLGRFVVNLNVTGTETDAFNVTIQNASGRTVDIGIRRNGTGGVARVDISSTRSYGPDTAKEVCVAVRGRVLLDVLDGTSYSGDCRFNATAGMEPPFTVQIEDGDNADGRFSLVTRGDVPGYDRDAPTNPNGNYAVCDSPLATGGDGEYNDPCRAPAVWSTNVTLAYSSASIDYRRTRNLSIYP